MTPYQHTQSGKPMLVVMILAALLFLAAGLMLVRPVLCGIPVFVLAGWLFNSLTIEIANGRLRWRFGPGLIQKSVSLDQIASAEPVRTNFLEGWGIHWSRFGWLYNISGYDAVAITLRNGKRFALGTDEPKVLAEHLQPRKER